MIHLYKEGRGLETGLSVGVGKTLGLVIAWCWFNVSKCECSYWYFRCRFHLSPHFIFRKGSWNVVEDYLFSRNVCLITEEVFADYIPKEMQINLKGLFK